METLETLCLQTLAVHISDLFNCICYKRIENPERQNQLTNVLKRLQMISQGIPPLMANDFTSIVLKVLTIRTSFINEDLHFDVQKKFLSEVLHPSVTKLHLPMMPAECDEFVYNKLFGTSLTKVEELRLEHCCSTSLQGFANLPHLHTIIFHSFCTDYFLENLWQSCGQKLRKLDIAYSGSVTPQGIKALHKFQCLEDLNIIRTGIKVGSFMRLAYGLRGGTLPPTLRKLSCANVTVCDLNVLSVGNYPNLRELHVEKLAPNSPIDKNIGNLKKLVLSFTTLNHNVLSLVGEMLTELHLIRVTNLDGRTLISQCPNLSHLEVKMCRHDVMMYEEDTSFKESTNTELSLLKHLELDTYYLLADVIFIQYGRNITHLSVIAEKVEERPMDEFLKVLTAVPQKLISISFRSSLRHGLLPTEVVNKLIALCPELEVIEGVAICDVSTLQKMNPSIKFSP